LTSRCTSIGIHNKLYFSTKAIVIYVIIKTEEEQRRQLSQSS